MIIYLMSVILSYIYIRGALYADFTLGGMYTPFISWKDVLVLNVFVTVFSLFSVIGCAAVYLMTSCGKHGWTWYIE